MLWRYQDEGIVLKCELRDDINNGRYTSIFACVYPVADTPIVIPETYFKLELRPDMGHHLIVTATKINDKQEVVVENWDIWFAPNS